jgi:hypothetical protein
MNIDAGYVLERSAIFEYDGMFERNKANMMAAGEADAVRPKHDGNHEKALLDYMDYIKAWKRGKNGDLCYTHDLPDIPPNVAGNMEAWLMFWQKADV